MKGLLKATILAVGCTAFSAAAAAKFNLEYDHVPDQLIVKFKANVKQASMLNTIEAMGADSLHTFKANGAMVVEFRAKGNKAALSKRAEMLASEATVAYVEANTILRADNMPNDTEFAQLYGMHNEGGTGGTIDADIDAVEAWGISTGSRNVVVAVIDTGIAYTHPDIAPNYWTNMGEFGLDAAGVEKSTNGIDDDMNGFIDDFRGWDFVNNDNDPMDDHNHGTHCAGTIGGAGNNGIGVAGVNWEVSLVGVKFLSGTGSGTLVDAVKAIEYVTVIGATMSSNSWGGGGYSDTMDAAIQAANAAGILFIAAAGNDASNNDVSPHYPSSYTADNVIAVAATDHNDGIANFSSFGATTVDVGAPGVDILSSIKDGTYLRYSGTSMATPHVAGVAALVKAVFPDATAAQIKARILNTADPVASLAGKTLTGGRVNAFNALEIDNIAPNAVGDIALGEATTTSVAISFAAAGDDGDVGVAGRYELRYGAEPIVDAAGWDTASRAAAVITLSGEMVNAVVNGLPLNFAGHVAVKAYDNVGNAGPVSASAPIQVVRVVQVMTHNADTLDDVTVEAPWGVEMLASRSGGVFSDSPDGNYANSIAISLTLAEITVDVPNPTLVFNTSFDLESGYDYGYVELSTDAGVTWVQVDRYTGMVNWGMKSYDLTTLLGGATTFRVRFRMTTDSSIEKDGWKIDDLAVFAPVGA